MSHPDPTRDYDDFDMMAERTIWPWIDDESHDSDDSNYDDYNDFHDGVDADDRTNDYWAGDDDLNNDYDDSMDGDHDSAMESAGWGTDEDYGYFGGDYDDF